VISPDNQARLLSLARRALEARVRRGDAPRSDDPFEIASGAFVTILHAGELRGCLGRLNVDQPLAHLVMELAQSVADSDPRFEPVRPNELQHITFEISVLTPEWEVDSVDAIEVGRHGLIVEQGRNRGLLLPQVATEHGWDRYTFLDHTCLKAGLLPGAWRRGARVFVFEAEVFGERTPAPHRGTDPHRV
jgi:AmmeMemoRadiSam system protein A